MPRFRMVNGKSVQLTPKEEATRDVEEAKWAAGETARTAKSEIQELENKITGRRLREAVLQGDGGWLASQDALIKTQRDKIS